MLVSNATDGADKWRKSKIKKLRHNGSASLQCLTLAV